MLRALRALGHSHSSAPRDPSQIAQTALHEGRTVELPLALIFYPSIPSDIMRRVGDVGLQW